MYVRKRPIGMSNFLPPKNSKFNSLNSFYEILNFWWSDLQSLLYNLIPSFVRSDTWSWSNWPKFRVESVDDHTLNPIQFFREHRVKRIKILRLLLLQTFYNTRNLVIYIHFTNFFPYRIRLWGISQWIIVKIHSHPGR